MSGLFSSAPPPPPVVVPPPPAPVPRMPDLGSPNAKEASLDQVTSAAGMGRNATDMTGKKKGTVLGGGSSGGSAAATTPDTYSNSKLG
jgi:hypothetical protein